MSICAVSSYYPPNRSTRFPAVNNTPPQNQNYLLAKQAADGSTVHHESAATNRHSNAFDSLAPNAPDSVKEAWDQAEQETGVNGYGKGADGKLTHLSSMLILQLEQRLTKGHTDLLGDTKQSAIEATQRALNRLVNPLMPKTDQNVIALQKDEQRFYEAFLENLEKIQ